MGFLVQKVSGGDSGAEGVAKSDVTFLSPLFRHVSPLFETEDRIFKTKTVALKPETDR